MAFCSTIATGKITVLTMAQAGQQYTASVLPQSTSLARITVEGNPNKGRLTEDSLAGIYASLIASGKLKSSFDPMGHIDGSGNYTDNSGNTHNINDIGKEELETINAIASEYCFYYVRYKFVLDSLFDKLITTSAQSITTEAARQEIATHLQLAKEINSKLNDLIQITNYIAKERADDITNQNNVINSLNTSITSNFEALKKHEKMLKSETSIADLRKSMVEYSQEKNLSAQNLLALYGFLNLVALGLLFYIARS